MLRSPTDASGHRRRPIRWLFPIIVAVVAAVVASCSYSQEPLSIDVPRSAESSRIFASDGRLITVVHGGENREVVTLDQVSEYVQNAVVAIEDERFWQHRGIDLKAIVRAAKENAAAGGFVEGGSTLEMQLAENLILGADRTLEEKQSIDAKLEEFALAQQLDESYSKAWVLESYLNTIFFCNNAWGIQAAAEEYFAKDALDLSIGESALLAGMIQRPCDLEPFDNLEAGLARRELVLRAMVRNGYITAAEADRAEREPLALAAETPVIDEEYPAPHFVDEVRAWFFDNEAFGETRDERQKLFFEGGLQIHTTVDLELQFGAAANVARVLGTDETQPRGALVSIEPGTGRVRAMVGGTDYFGEGEFSKVNLAMGRGRQAGSSFKPLVLAAAVNLGFPLTTEFPAPGQIELPLPNNTTWNVSNYSGGGSATLDLLEATVNSSNTVYAQLVQQVGPAEANAMAAELGVSANLLPIPATVLGSNEVTVLDMANSYSSFAAEGVATDPVLVEKVIGPDGAEIYRAPLTSVRVMDRDDANRVTGALEQVVSRGTGTKARLDDRPAAGKTGTNQQWRDAWFVGYTPELATAVWVGFPEGQISMEPPLTEIRVTGGSWPAEIWHDYTEFALRGTEPQLFPEAPPEPERPKNLDNVVPPVVGRTATQAVRAIKNRGLTAQVQQVPARGQRVGMVVGQAPAADTPSLPGTPVILTVTSAQGTTAQPRPNPQGQAPNNPNAAAPQANTAVATPRNSPPFTGPFTGPVTGPAPTVATPADTAPAVSDSGGQDQTSATPRPDQ